MDNKRLLILACSKRKVDTPGEIRAIDRYDGYFFRILKNSHHSNLDVIILSAKFGLLSSEDPIPWYDHKMDIHDVARMSKETLQRFTSLVPDVNKYLEVAINLGSNYMECFAPTMDYIKRSYHGKVIIIDGPLGIRGQKLKEWVSINLNSHSYHDMSGLL